MRPTLILQPIHNSSANILKTFAIGKPLTTDQISFLEDHQQQLSCEQIDPLLNYYLKESRERRRKFNTTFLLPHEEMNFEAIQLLKKRLLSLLQDNSEHAVVTLTEKQYLAFKDYTTEELIYWHGNQFITGAPFFPGGIPPVIHFQWGNLFGIVLYVLLPFDRLTRINTVIYFESMRNRNLNQCVDDYNKKFQENLKWQNEIFRQKDFILKKDVANKNTITSKENELHHTPRLTLSNYFLLDHI